MIPRPRYGLGVRGLALIGRLLYTSNTSPDPLPRRDSVGSTKQITTITCGAPDNSSDYTVAFTSTADGASGEAVSVTVTTDASATDAELRTLLLAALYDEPGFMRFVESIGGTTTTLVVTFLEGQKGTFEFTANPSTALTQAATQAQADSQEYLYGRAVEVVARPDDNVSNEGVRPLVAGAGEVLTVTTNTAANTETSTAVYAYTPAGGATRQVTVVFTSGADATAATAAAVIAYAAAFPNATVTDNDPTATVSFPMGDTVALISITNTGLLDVSASVAAGSAVPRCTLVYNDQTEPISDAYPSTAAPTGTTDKTVSTIDAGVMNVERDTSETITKGGIAWAETADGANKGRLYATPSPTRTAVLVGNGRIPCRFEAVDPSVSTLAALHIGA